MPALAVTSVVAAILALIFFRLSFAVIGLRRRHRVSLCHLPALRSQLVSGI